MSTIRGVKDRRFKFTQILNTMFEDPTISLKAKGLIGYCLTKPEDWRFHISHLASVLKEGEKSIYSAIDECISGGYAIRYQKRRPNGDFGEWETIVSDSRVEIDFIKKELEEQGVFQKMFTLRPFADAQLADAQKVPPSNTDSSNTEKKQQHAAAPAVVFSASKKEQQQKQYAGNSGQLKIVPILEKIDIPTKDKIEISKTYSLQQIQHSLEWIAKCKEPIRSLAATIKWACKNQPEIPVSKQDLEQVSKTYALKYDGKKNGNIVINALGKYVEIISGGQEGYLALEYAAKGFIDRFQSALRKFKFEVMPT
jgi:hypothetical protein